MHFSAILNLVNDTPVVLHVKVAGANGHLEFRFDGLVHDFAIEGAGRIKTDTKTRQDTQCFRPVTAHEFGERRGRLGHHHVVGGGKCDIDCITIVR